MPEREALRHILDTARKDLGVREVPGKKSHPLIVGWLFRFARNVKTAWILRKGDDIAWCAVFVSAVLDECGYRGTDHALARSYVSWGKPSKPIPGCVVVLRRKGKPGADRATGSRAGYHVAFLEHYGKRNIRCIGGNQRNRVSSVAYSRRLYEVVGQFRMPAEL